MAVDTLRVTLTCLHDKHKLLIPANPYPMYPHPERLNHLTVDSATGVRHVFDDGPTRIVASITWKAIAYDVVKQYEDFLLKHIMLGLHPFEIKCPKYIDFGMGKSNDIDAAYYAGSPNLKDIISSRDESGLFYDIELPYMFVRDKNA